jgi:DNA-binding CsgD family transcriptional regulator
MAHQPSLAAAPDQTALEITRLGLGALQASGALFYWVDAAQGMADVSLAGIPRQFYLNYAADMEETDPSNVRRMATAGHSVTQLRQSNPALPDESAVYRRLLAEHGVTDVIDLMFRAEGIAVAGVGFLKRAEDPPVDAATIGAARAIQRFVEHSLQNHERVRAPAWRRALARDYALTPREIAVAELVQGGLSNAEIAEALGMKLPTVKTHLAQVFGKTGCATRTKLAACFRL